MFAGHLGVALAAKRAAPLAPLAALVGATYALDFLWPVLLLAGVETVRIDPGNTAVTPLAFDSYPWSHSLLMVLVWGGAVWAIARLRLGPGRAALVIGAVLVSHWVLDFVTHRPDLPLWPAGPEVGLGLWRSLPATLAVEGSMFAVGVWLYVTATRPRNARGTWTLVSLLGVVLLIWLGGPFAPPPPGVQAIAFAGLALLLLVPWAAWVERHRLPLTNPHGGVHDDH